MAQLEHLANSERAVLLFSLRALFLLLSLILIGFSTEALDAFMAAGKRDNFFDAFALSRAILWLIISGMSLVIAYVLNQVSEYPDSAQKINAKIAKLTGKTKPEEK